MIKERKEQLERELEEATRMEPPTPTAINPNAVENSRLGGGMVYYGYRLIVAASKKCMDVHCLGEEPGIQATPHSVVTEVYAQLVDQLGIKTLDEMPAEWRRLSFETELTLRPPHVIDTDKGKTSQEKVRDDLLLCCLWTPLVTYFAWFSLRLKSFLYLG